MKNKSIKKSARLACLLFLILAIITLYGYTNTPVKFKEEKAVTTNHILPHDHLFRSEISSDLMGHTPLAFLQFLYGLLKPGIGLMG